MSEPPCFCNLLGLQRFSTPKSHALSNSPDRGASGTSCPSPSFSKVSYSKVVPFNRSPNTYLSTQAWNDPLSASPSPGRRGVTPPPPGSRAVQWCPCPWSLPTLSDTCRSSLLPSLTCVHGLQIHHPAPGGAKASAPPGPSLLPQPGPRGSQGLPPPALCRRSCSHCKSGCHLGRALRCSGPGSTPRTGLAHSPGEHAARGGGLGHAPWQGPRAWPRAHAKQGFAYVELGAGRGVSRCCRGGSGP